MTRRASDVLAQTHRGAESSERDALVSQTLAIGTVSPQGGEVLTRVSGREPATGADGRAADRGASARDGRGAQFRLAQPVERRRLDPKQA